MSQLAWRIATDTPDYQADDLSGAGAKATGGRWNEPGCAAIYASATRALACLETIVHLNAGGLPFNRYLVELRIPADIWTKAERQDATHLPVGWDAEPAGQASIRLGTRWLRGRSSAILIVPSVIVSEESNCMINPMHRDTARITSTKLRKWLYDPRFQKNNSA